MRTVTIGGGAVVSRFVGNSYAKDATKGLGKPVIKGLLHIAVGAFGIPLLAKGEMGENIGDGFIAEGALRIAESKMPDKFGVGAISEDQLGATRDYVIDEDRVHGEMDGTGDSNLSGSGDSNLGAIDMDQVADDVSGYDE